MRLPVRKQGFEHVQPVGQVPGQHAGFGAAGSGVAGAGDQGEQPEVGCCPRAEDLGARATAISRGHNIGPELVRTVLAWAESHRAGRVGLWVNEANRPAISLYERAGFRRTGEVD